MEKNILIQIKIFTLEERLKKLRPIEKLVLIKIINTLKARLEGIK